MKHEKILDLHPSTTCETTDAKFSCLLTESGNHVELFFNTNKELYKIVVADVATDKEYEELLRTLTGKYGKTSGGYFQFKSWCIGHKSSEMPCEYDISLQLSIGKDYRPQKNVCANDNGCWESMTIHPCNLYFLSNKCKPDSNITVVEYSTNKVSHTWHLPPSGKYIKY